MLTYTTNDGNDTIQVALGTDHLPVTSESGIYLTIHAPRTLSPAKEVWKDESGVMVPRELTRLLDRDGGVLVEATVTSGASVYDVSLSVTYNGQTRSVAGKTNQTMRVEVGG